MAFFHLRKSVAGEISRPLTRSAPLILCLVGFFGWVTVLPLYGSAAVTWASARETAYPSLPLWFLAGNVPTSILCGFLWDRRPDLTVPGVRLAVAAEAVFTLLLLRLPAPLWPALFVAMGLAMAPVVAWGRWFATTVDAAWLGRTFGLSAAGVAGARLLFDLLGRSLAPALTVLLTLILLVMAVLALERLDVSVHPSRRQPVVADICPRAKLRTLVGFGLFIILFSLVAGLSYRYLIATPMSPLVDESLRYLPYMVAAMVSGVVADRWNLYWAMAAGAVLLALASLLIALGTPAAISTGLGLQGAAFGLLESAPWLLLAGHAAPGTAGRWFGWGLNMNVVPILLAGSAAALVQNLSPERFGLLAAALLLLAILALQGVSDPLTVLHRWDRLSAEEGESVPAVAASGLVATETAVPVVDLLVRHFAGHLTERELEVAQLAVLGIRTRDIAAQLYISENTVKTHLRRVYRKTGAANRDDLYRQLVERGSL